MCLGVPGRIVERDDTSDVFAGGLVEFAGVRRRVSLACVPEAQVGDYVVVHAGIAISRIDAEEAQHVFAYMQQTGEDELGESPS